MIVGLGLIGGSYARALKKKDFYVMAIDTNRDSIDYALREGFIDEGSTDTSLLHKADVIILALYPTQVVEWVKTHRTEFAKNVRITDVTGIKSAIVYEIQDLLGDNAEFIAAHPMAGREVQGVQNSDDAIFTNANYIVVPTEKNTPEAVAWCRELGGLLGFSRICELSPKEHDRMIAFVSQLTHCIAVSLMTCEDDENIRDYTGDSFRDLTRIANINEDMWTELFFMNREALLDRLDLFINEMETIREMIRKEDTEGLKEKMRLSTRRRKRFNRDE